MKLVFIYPDFSIGAKGKFYHGIASISSVLNKEGYTTSLIHLVKSSSTEEVVERLKRETPQLIAFSATTNMFPYVKKYARAIKDHLDVPILCGGIHATLEPESFLDVPEVDFICVGEGEEAIVEFCHRLSDGKDVTSVRNICFKKDSKLICNGLRPLIEDLDSLPFVDRQIFDYADLEDARLGRVVFMASRGCPYDCSFCSNHQLKKVYKGKYVRFRSVSSVVEEAQQVLSQQPAQYAIFHDDIFTLNKKWLDEFRVEWKKKINLPFSCNSRVNLLDEDVARMLKDSGCFEVSMGIESGNPVLRKEVLNRKMSNQDIRKAFSLCHKYRIRTVSYNMVGLPFEDMSSVLETVRLNAEVKPDNLQVSIFYPYPKTRLFELSKEQGFLTDKTSNSYFEETTLKQPTITDEQVGFVFQYFGALVRIYHLLFTLPPALSRLSCAIFKRIVSWRLTAKLLYKRRP